MNIQMIAFDVAGTTVQDGGLVLRAFKRAFSQIEPERWPTHETEWTQYAIDTMGQSKIEVFTAILGDADLAAKATEAFEAAYLEIVVEEGIEEIPGAGDLLVRLKDAGVPTALTTGFSRVTLNAILRSLDWGELVEETVTPGEVGAGRPSPKMLQRVAAQLEVTDPAACVVVGDTQSDMQAGVAFGAGQVIGVLSGTHNREQLLEAGATAVVNSVAELPNLLFKEVL